MVSHSLHTVSVVLSEMLRHLSRLKRLRKRSKTKVALKGAVENRGLSPLLKRCPDTNLGVPIRVSILS
jgi:hypothetical protein